jgi:hypothetical protein
MFDGRRIGVTRMPFSGEQFGGRALEVRRPAAHRR